MKWLTVVTILLLSNFIAGKSVTKHATKKASSAKPTKTPKSIVDQFTALPADDLAFIKELDKQFKLHGDNIKFKVVKDNSTKPSKNNKRTIDGELGYGYQQNYYQGGFQFVQPPIGYQQHHGQYYHQNLFQPNHGQFGSHQNQFANEVRVKPRQRLHTTVEIIPSRSYEIKETPHGYNTILPGHENHFYQQSHPQAQIDPPVIVLKIPGPSKYAAHLQALLQQYLEIRAQQVIQALEEEELRHQHAAAIHHHQQQQHLIHQQQQIEQLHLTQSIASTLAPQTFNAPQYLPAHSHSGEQQIYQQQGSYEVPASDSYEVQPQLQDHGPVYQDQSQEQPDIIYHQPAAQPHEPQYSQEEDIVYHDINVQPTPQPHQEYGVPIHSHEEEQSPDVPLVENYPDAKHTRVLLPPKATIKPDPQYAHDNLAVKDKYAPPAPTYEDTHENPEVDYQYTAGDQEEEVEITQRPPVHQPAYPTRAPFNYHAHGLQGHHSLEVVHDGNAKRETANASGGRLRKKTRRVLRRTKKPENDNIKEREHKEEQ